MTKKGEAQTTDAAPACCAAGRPPSAVRVAAPEVAVPEASAGPRSRDGMVRLPGGRFLMGADDAKGFPQDGEGPVRKVNLEPFWIGARAVTNAEFAAFVGATGYRTEAERIGWSYVFDGFLTPAVERRVKGVAGGAPWWCAVVGASWERPEGPGSDLEGRLDHPAVHVSHNDSLAYCSWTGWRLPTEAEWEYAARGGLKQRRFPWGNTLTPAQKHRCNVWQGTFPDTDNAEDGYSGTAPADAYEPNDFGLYNVAGNVWEWCSDWFSPTYHAKGSHGGKETLDNPTGPPNGVSRVIRGGSYLCHKSYCNRYRVAARSKNTPDSSTGNMGFRCAA